MRYGASIVPANISSAHNILHRVLEIEHEVKPNEFHAKHTSKSDKGAAENIGGLLLDKKEERSMRKFDLESLHCIERKKHAQGSSSPATSN
jgi:hypothetical protein